MENLNSNLDLDKILQSRQNVVSEVLNKKSGENSKLNKKIINLIVNRKQEEKKEPEIKLSPSINLKNLMINIDMDSLNEKDKEKLLEYSINMGIVKEIIMKKGCEFILDVFKQKEKTIVEELDKHGYNTFDDMIDLLENIKEKFEEKSEYKNNASLLPVVSADLENLKKQMYSGEKEFKNFLKEYKAKRDELIKINKEFVEFLNNPKKDSKIKNNRKEVEDLCSKIAEKVYELEESYEELYNYEINEYLVPTSNLIKELQKKWEKNFLKLTSKESIEKNELDLNLSIIKKHLQNYYLKEMLKKKKHIC